MSQKLTKEGFAKLALEQSEDKQNLQGSDAQAAKAASGKEGKFPRTIEHFSSTGEGDTPLEQLEFDIAWAKQRKKNYVPIMLSPEDLEAAIEEIRASERENIYNQLKLARKEERERCVKALERQNNPNDGKIPKWGLAISPYDDSAKAAWKRAIDIIKALDKGDTGRAWYDKKDKELR